MLIEVWSRITLRSIFILEKQMRAVSHCVTLQRILKSEVAFLVQLKDSQEEKFYHKAERCFSQHSIIRGAEKKKRS